MCILPLFGCCFAAKSVRDGYVRRVVCAACAWRGAMRLLQPDYAKNDADAAYV